MEKDISLERVSRLLSLVLRHEPQKIGVQLDAQGWVGIDDLLQRLGRYGMPLDREGLDRLVQENDKQRFAISDDGLRIRASQGHSIAVDLGLAPAVPPPWLYHGTVPRFLAAIAAEGLRPGQRQHVHLSQDRATALQVGARRGRPVVLSNDTGRMHADGHVFHQSANGVWLTAHVPPNYIAG